MFVFSPYSLKFCKILVDSKDTSATNDKGSLNGDKIGQTGNAIPKVDCRQRTKERMKYSCKEFNDAVFKK